MSIHPDPLTPPVPHSYPSDDEGAMQKAVTWITDGVTKAAIRFVDPGLPRAQEVSQKLAELASGDPACGDMIDLILSRLIEWGQIEASGPPTPFTPVAKKIAIYTADEGTKAGVAQFLKVFIGELILHLGKEMGEEFPDAPTLMNAVTGRILETVFSELENLEEGAEEEAANRIVDELFHMAFEKGGVNWLVAYAGRHRLKPILKDMLSGALAEYFRNIREIQDVSKQFRDEAHFKEFDPTFQTIHKEIQKEIDRALFYLPGQIEVFLGEDASEERVYFLSEYAASVAKSQYLARQSLIHDLTSVILGSLFDPSQSIQGETRSFAKETLPFVLSELIASKEGVAKFLDLFAITDESNEYRLQQLLVQNVLKQRRTKLIEAGEEVNRTAITLVDRQIETLQSRVPQEKLSALLAPIQGIDEVDWSGRLLSVLHEDDFRVRRKLLRELGMNVLMAPAAERLLTNIFQDKFQHRMSDDLFQKISQAILGGGLQLVARHLSNFSFDFNIAANEYLLEAEVARLNLISIGAHDIVLDPLEEVMNLLFSKIEGFEFGNPIVDGIFDACVKDEAIGNPAPFLRNVSTVFVARTLERVEGESFQDKLESIASEISIEISDAVKEIQWVQRQPFETKKAWFEKQRKADYTFYLFAKQLKLEGEALHDAMFEFAAAKELSGKILNVFTTKEDLEEILPMSFSEFPIHDMIVNQMAWQLAPYMPDICEMAEAGVSFTAQVEAAREYLHILEGEESKILHSLELLIQQASARFSAGDSPASRLVKALANENLLEKPAVDMATVCVAKAIRALKGDVPREKMASLLEKLEEPVIRALYDYRLYQAGNIDAKERDYREAILNPQVKQFADTLKGEGEVLCDQVMQFVMAREMSQGITSLFIDSRSLSDRDRPVYDLIVDQLTYHIKPYFKELQKYHDVRELLFQLTDDDQLSKAKQIIEETGGEDLQQLMQSMLGEGLSLSKQQLVTGDEIVDDLIAAAFEGDWKGVTAEKLLENASILLTAQALRLAEGETFEKRIASISQRLTDTIESSFSGYKSDQDHIAATTNMVQGIFEIFSSTEDLSRPLYQYLLGQAVENLAPTTQFLFNYYEVLREQKPLEGEPHHLEQMMIDVAFVGIEEVEAGYLLPTTFEKMVVKSLIPELEKLRQKAQSGEESALLDIVKGGIRLVGKGVPNFFQDPEFLRSGLLKLVSVATDASSREPTEDERARFGNMDQFSEELSRRLLRIMFDKPVPPSIQEALRDQLKQQLRLLASENELARNYWLRDQLQIYHQRLGKRPKKEAVVPFIRSRYKKLEGEEKDIERVKGEIAALASEIVLDQVEHTLSERVPLSGFFAFLFRPILSFFRALLFFRLQWLMMKVLDSTSGEQGQIMMFRMIWETVGLFDPQEKVAELERERRGRLRRFLSELKNRPFEFTSPFLSSSFIIGEDDSIAGILRRFHQNLHGQKTST